MAGILSGVVIVEKIMLYIHQAQSIFRLRLIPVQELITRRAFLSVLVVIKQTYSIGIKDIETIDLRSHPIIVDMYLDLAR